MISLDLLFQHATSQTHNPVNVIIARTLQEYGLDTSEDHHLVNMRHETFTSEIQPSQTWVLIELNIKCPKCSEVHTLKASAVVEEEDPIEKVVNTLLNDAPEGFLDFLKAMEKVSH